MADGSSTARTYWAAEPDIKKLAPRVQERFAWWMSLLDRSGRWGKMRKMLSCYYGSGTDGMRDSSAMQDAGEDGEVTELHVNQVRPVINNTLSLIAGTDPAVKARAKNADAKTLAQTRLAEALLESYDNSIASKEREIDCVRGALLASSWSLGQSWLPRDGKEWTRDPEGKPVYEGDIDLFVLPPWRAIYDFAAADESKRKWCLFRRSVSRYDTAAQFEEMGDAETANKLRQHVQSSPQKWYGAAIGATMSELDVLLGESLPEEDVLWVWELRHLPSPALPKGRLVRFVEPDVVLWDSMAQKGAVDPENPDALVEPGVAYPYDELHLYEYSPERVVCGSAGHTGAFDLGALQEFSDICTASIATTVNINGQMHLYSADETPPNVHDLSTGNSVLTGKSPPVPLEYPALKEEVLKALDWAVETGNKMCALNNTVMGEPDKGMPASAQALQRAQAMQYHAVSQAERVRLRSRNANGKLLLLKRFARSPRQVEIAGKARAYEMREWQADDLSDVVRFDVEPINPMSNSFEGRQAALELLMQMGTIKDGTAALTFLQTGSLEAVTQTQTAQRELVEANVALLQKGIGPPPVDMQASMASGAPVFVEPPPGPEGKPAETLRIYKSDPHHLAIQAYLGVLASPASRSDAKMVQACQEAVLLSLQLWQQLLPDEAAAYGIPPLPSQLAMALPPPGAPGAGGPPGEPPPGPEAAGGPPEQPGLPKPPEDPLTGQQEGPPDLPQ